MDRSYFVRVYAANRRALLDLQAYGFDLFRATARTTPEAGPSIEGLLTMEQVERLVLDGYRVLVEEEASRRARARQEVADFDDWLKEHKG